MPVKEGSKHPAMPHNGGRWSWAKLHQWRNNEGSSASTYDACILLQDLCVIDVDDEKMATELEAKFPVLHDVPMEKTQRGRHYWFRRSDEADTHGYYDGHGQRQQGIDFKTRCRTGTGGIIVIAPSMGKTWVKGRELHPDTLIQIPFDLLDAVSVPNHRIERHVFKFLDCDDPVETDTLSLNSMSYFEPFSSGDMFDDNVIPVPCTQEEYSTLMRIVAYRDSEWSAPSTPEEWSTAIRVGDKLGLTTDIDLYEKMTRSRTLWRYDLQTRWPDMANAIDLENAYRRGEGCDASICIDVDEKIRGGHLLYDPLPSWDHDDLSLFGKSGPSTQHVGGQTVVIHDDVLQRVCDTVPRIVQDLMETLPLVLAGGSVLGIVANRDVVECGHDYDLFAYGLDDDAADEMLETITEQFLPSPAWRLIQTPNAWTFIEQLRRDAPEGRLCQSWPEGPAEGTSPLVIQVILRLYRNPYEVAVGFDISAARIAVWAHQQTGLLTVQACPSWFETMRRMMIPVEPIDTLFSNATSMRIVKYAGKGFDVMFPGLRKSLLSTVDVVKKKDSRLLKGVRVLTYIHQRLGGRWPDPEVRKRELPSIVRSIRYYASEYADEEIKVTLRFIHALASIPWACMRAVKGLFGGRRRQTWESDVEMQSPARLTLWIKFGDRQPSAFKPEKPCLRNLHCQDSRLEILTCETLGIEHRVGTTMLERINVMLQQETLRCEMTELETTIVLGRMFQRMQPHLEEEQVAPPFGRLCQSWPFGPAAVDTVRNVFRRVSEEVCSIRKQQGPSFFDDIRMSVDLAFDDQRESMYT